MKKVEYVQHPRYGKITKWQDEQMKKIKKLGRSKERSIAKTNECLDLAISLLRTMVR